MACYRPMRARIMQAQTDAGKRKLVVLPRDGDTIKGTGRPYDMALQDGEIYVPCGKCLGCRLDHAQMWSMRCMAELLYHDCASFITMTYNDSHIPTTPAGHFTLCKDDLTKFFKRIRKNTGLKLRYFACGEYGTHTLRPHFHAIIYGYWPVDARPSTSGPVDGERVQMYESAELERYWGLGRCIVGTVTQQSCGYVARYTLSKQDGAIDDLLADHGLVRPYIVMSRRPGLGRLYLDDHMEEIYATDELTLSSASGGLSSRPPRYYDKVLDMTDTVCYDNIKAQRRVNQAIAQRNADLVSQQPYAERLAIAERRKIAQTVLLSKRGKV